MNETATQLKTRPLGDYLRIKHGFAFKSEYFADTSDLIVLTPGNFFEKGGFRDRGHKDKGYKGPIPDGYILKNGDLLIAMTEQGEGLLGSAAIVPNSDRYLHNQRLGLVEKLEGLDPLFTYYLLNTSSVRRQISNSANGTKVRHTSPDKIYQVRVSVPVLEEQVKIGQSLNHYDSLIGDNIKRINLLKELAKKLYQFHFDCPESTDWELSPLKDFGKVITGKTPSKAKAENYSPNGMMFIKTPDMHDQLFILNANEKISTEGELTQISKTLPVGTICISCIGTIGVVSLTTAPSQTNQQINAIVLSDEDYREYLFFRLEDSKKTLENLGSNGATMSNVNKSKLENLKISNPPQHLVRDYHLKAEPIFRLIEVLMRKNILLNLARDLLLPRLMSGEIKA